MKKGWQLVPMGEACPISSRKPEVFRGERRYFSTGAIGPEGELSEPEYVDHSNRPSRAGCMPRVGDIGFARMKGTKKVILIDESLEGALFSTGFCFVAPQPTVDPHFAFLFITSDEFQNAKNAAAGDGIMGGIKNAAAAAIQMPLPPLSEQRRIVGLLDEALASLATAQAHAEKNYQNARLLFESHLQSVFTQRGKGWVERAFSDLCDIKHGYAFEGEFFSNEGEYVLLTPGNFHERGGYRDRAEKQKFYTGEVPRDYLLNEGDLLVAMTEQAAGLLGSPILVPESGKFLHNQRLGLVMQKPGVPWKSEFFFHVFNTQSVRKAIHASASGVKVRHTSPTKIGEVVVAFPTSLTEQEHIVAALASLSAETQRLAMFYERKQAALAALKQSLLRQAFAGNL